jgi:hypothetical protein
VKGKSGHLLLGSYLVYFGKQWVFRILLIFRMQGLAFFTSGLKPADIPT